MTSKSKSNPADTAETAQESTPSSMPGESSEQVARLPAKEGVYPDPSDLSVSLPPPPPPLPEERLIHIYASNGRREVAND